MGARVLYGLLDDYAGMSAECWPHQSTAGARIGRSTRSVKRYVAILMECGYLTIRRGQSGNRYRLSWATEPGINDLPQIGPSEVPMRPPEYIQPAQELAVSNSNSIGSSDGVGWEFGLDDAVALFNWAAEAPPEDAG